MCSRSNEHAERSLCLYASLCTPLHHDWIGSRRQSSKAFHGAPMMNQTAGARIALQIALTCSAKLMDFHHPRLTRKDKKTVMCGWSKSWQMLIHISTDMPHCLHVLQKSLPCSQYYQSTFRCNPWHHVVFSLSISWFSDVIWNNATGPAPMRTEVPQHSYRLLLTGGLLSTEQSLLPFQKSSQFVHENANRLLLSRSID